jgi:mRNA-degrading endonuclease RelE of RelBE toxin-antitoxin system
MRFVETPVFTKELKAFLTEEDYRILQTTLMLRPEQGPIIPGTGGLRKLRWGGKGHGKRGGFRIIYFWDKGKDAFYMLFVYAKNQQEKLTPQQCRILKQIVQEELL